jgi:hypothetical protein
MEFRVITDFRPLLELPVDFVPGEGIEPAYDLVFNPGGALPGAELWKKARASRRQY